LNSPERPTFLRAVSRWEIVALSINDVVGSGVYLILPVAAAQLLGPASVWAILAAGIAVFLLVLCFAEAGSMFDKPGGGYVYTRAAFGDFVGFEVGWMTWIARIASVASLSVFFSRAVGYLWEGANRGFGQAATIFLGLAFLTTINVVGVKSGARTAVVLAFGKLVPLFVLVLVGFFAVDWSRVFPVPAPPSENFTKAALLVLFAYAGFENTAAAAGEYKNPQRDVPFALFVMISIVTLIYTLVQLVAIGTIPNLGVSQTPLADAGRLLLGPAGGLLLTVGAALSQQHDPRGPAVSLCARRDRPPPPGLREDPPALADTLRRDPDAGRDRRRAHRHGLRAPHGAPVGVRRRRKPGRAFGHRPSRDVHRHLPGHPGSPPQDPGDGANHPPARRSRHPDRGSRHLSRVSLRRGEAEFHRGSHRAGRGGPDLRGERTGGES
jgi:hypothetical protein